MITPSRTVTTTDGRPPVVARVTAVFPFVDQGPRTAIVEALVDNAGRRFLPGQYVTMQFVTGERTEALSVPRGAVVRMGGKARVWVVADGRAEPREVTTGLENPERVEITGGLRGDEHVVARITGGVKYYDGRVYVPLSGSEEFNSGQKDYPCCTARGGVVALDASTGKVIWKAYNVDEPKPWKVSASGVQLYGPSAGGVWKRYRNLGLARMAITPFWMPSSKLPPLRPCA